MKNIVVGLLASCSLLAAPPAYAQAAPAPAASAAPASDDLCEDNNYVPVYELKEDGSSNSLAEPGAKEPEPTPTPTPTTTTPTPKPPTTTTPPRTITPVSVPGSNRTVSGQPVKVKSPSVDTASLTTAMRSILDDVYRVAREMGMPTPVITSGDDSKHKNGSLHYSGNAIDLRCNSAFASTARCRAYAQELQRVIGRRYQVIFEVFPNNPANNHIHIEYDPN